MWHSQASKDHRWEKLRKDGKLRRERIISDTASRLKIKINIDEEIQEEIN